jgi:hypothetical protein
MHIAAALRKPVVAVFGGGHWPQFTPAVTPSVAMTMGLPCVQCSWVCHLPESLCVKRVPVSAVKEAVAAISRGAMVGREARMIAPSRMLVEAAQYQRHDEPQAIDVPRDKERTNMAGQTDEGPSSSTEVMDGVEASLLTAVTTLRGEFAALKAQMGGDGGQAANLQRELKAMMQAAIEREREYARRDSEWRDKLLEATTQAHAAKFDAGQLSDRLTTAENANREYAAQAVQIEGRLRQQGARIAELEGAVHASQEGLRGLEAERVRLEGRNAELSAACSEQAGEMERLRASGHASEERAQALEARVAELISAHGALESERDTFASRVRELSSSRSRRLLLKLHLVSPCAWEAR